MLNLLKKEKINVTRENLRLDRPQFVMGVFEPEQLTKPQPAALADTKTQFIQVVENRDITITCKFLRALESERFMKNDEEDKASQKDEELLREPMTHDECWDVLVRNCCRPPASGDVVDAAVAATAAAAGASSSSSSSAASGADVVMGGTSAADALKNTVGGEGGLPVPGLKKSASSASSSHAVPIVRTASS